MALDTSVHVLTTFVVVFNSTFWRLLSKSLIRLTCVSYQSAQSCRNTSSKWRNHKNNDRRSTTILLFLQDSIPGRYEGSFCSTKCLHRVWANPILIFNCSVNHFPESKEAEGMKPTTDFDLVSRSRIKGAMLPRPHTPSWSNSSSLLLRGLVCCWLHLTHQTWKQYRPLRHWLPPTEIQQSKFWKTPQQFSSRRRILQRQ